MTHVEHVERLVPAGIAEVRDTLLRVERIRRWFPVEFTIAAARPPARLGPDHAIEAEARALERTLRFRVSAPVVENRRLRIELDGFVLVTVDADLAPGREGTRLAAAVAVAGRDLVSWLAVAAVAGAGHHDPLGPTADAIAAEAGRGGGARRPAAARRRR